MADFIFSPIPKVPFRIENEAGELIREYTLDVGSDMYFRAVIEKGQAVVKTANGLLDGAVTCDDLLALIRDFIDYAFNAPGEFDFLYNAFGKNVFALVELVRAVSKRGTEAMEEKLAKNAAVYGG